MREFQDDNILKKNSTKNNSFDKQKINQNNPKDFGYQKNRELLNEHERTDCEKMKKFSHIFTITKPNGCKVMLYAHDGIVEKRDINNKE